MKLKGIVIHPLKCVYWYLPKTCCTTMKWLIASLLNLKVPYRDGSDMDIHGQDIGFEFTEELVPEYYNFAFVRNPFDRIVSLYSQKIHTENVDRKVFPDEDLFYSYMPFEEFLDKIIAKEDKERHYMLQSYMLHKDINVHRIEDVEWLKYIKPKNTSAKLDVLTTETKIKIFNHYKEDFTRFGY